MTLVKAWPPDSSLPLSRKAYRVYQDPPPKGINDGYMGLAWSTDDAQQRYSRFGGLRLEAITMPRGDVEKALAGRAS